MSVEVAKTILEQLGGRKFLVMTGATNLIGGENHLSMKLPGSARCNGRICSGVRITLTPSDTYTVEAFVVRKLKYTVLDSRNDVYFDSLPEVFTSLTGLATKLF